MGKHKKKPTQQSNKTDDVFKVKNKTSKKSKSISKAIKTKSMQALQQGREVLDDKFVQLHQQQTCSTSHNKVQHTGVQCARQAVNVEDTIKQLAKL